MCIKNAVNVGSSVAVMWGEAQGLCSECIFMVKELQMLDMLDISFCRVQFVNILWC